MLSPLFHTGILPVRLIDKVFVYILYHFAHIYEHKLFFKKSVEVLQWGMKSLENMVLEQLALSMEKMKTTLQPTQK